LTLCGCVPLASDMQKISFNLDTDILTSYPRELDLNDDLLRGLTHIDTWLPIAGLRGALPSPRLMDEFLKQPTNLFLHWEKWPGWQLFSHTVLLNSCGDNAVVPSPSGRGISRPPILPPSGARLPAGVRRLARRSIAQSASARHLVMPPRRPNRTPAVA